MSDRGRRYSTRSERPTHNPFLLLPRDQPLVVEPFAERVKREYETADWVEPFAKHVNGVDEEWLHRKCAQWLEPQADNATIDSSSREARALGECLDIDKKSRPPPALNFCLTDGSATFFVNAVNEAIRLKTWSELALLLMQLEMWAETLHRRNPLKPWWERAASARSDADLPPEMVDLEPAAPSESAEAERTRLLKYVIKLLKESEPCEVRVPRVHHHEGKDYSFWTWNRVMRCSEGLLLVEHPKGYAYVPGIGMIDLEDEGERKHSFGLLQSKRESPGCLLVRSHDLGAPSSSAEPTSSVVRMEVAAPASNGKRVRQEEPSGRKKSKQPETAEATTEAGAAEKVAAEKSVATAKAKKATSEETAAAKAPKAAEKMASKEAKAKADNEAKEAKKAEKTAAKEAKAKADKEAKEAKAAEKTAAKEAKVENDNITKLIRRLRKKHAALAKRFVINDSDDDDDEARLRGENELETLEVHLREGAKGGCENCALGDNEHDCPFCGEGGFGAMAECACPNGFHCGGIDSDEYDSDEYPLDEEEIQPHEYGDYVMTDSGRYMYIGDDPRRDKTRKSYWNDEYDDDGY